mgnify:CR=1 FL=1
MNMVTILILVDGFLQYLKDIQERLGLTGHNPYFSRWFSAIEGVGHISIRMTGHNPYFSRWFSAMLLIDDYNNGKIVTILILVDGFLQYQILVTSVLK